MANAVPAYATSPGQDLDLRPGTSAVTLTDDGFDRYYDLRFTSLSVFVPYAVAANQLTLTVVFSPTAPGGESDLYVFRQPLGWTVAPQPDTTTPSAVFSFDGAVTAGSQIAMPNDIYVGADQPISSQTGTFVVTAQAPGLTSDVATFSTPPPSASARRRRGTPRHRRASR